MWFGLVGSGLVFWSGQGGVPCLVWKSLRIERAEGGQQSSLGDGRCAGRLGGEGRGGRGGKQKRKKDGCWFRGGKGGEGRGRERSVCMRDFSWRRTQTSRTVVVWDCSGWNRIIIIDRVSDENSP